MRGELPRLRCVRHTFGEVSLDWNRAPWDGIECAELQLAENGLKPRQGTQVKAGWDAEYLRLFFFAEDSRPWATLTERDAPLYKEEVVEVFLDPVGDLGAYFEFEVNPNNAVLDLCVRKIRSGYRKDFRWRCEVGDRAACVFLRCAAARAVECRRACQRGARTSSAPCPLPSQRTLALQTTR